MAYVRLTDPFTGSDLVSAMQTLRDGCVSGLSLDVPLFIDASRITTGPMNSAEINRMVLQRPAMEDVPANRPVAVVVPDVRFMVMLRLYGVMAHMSGLREERRQFTTLRTAEAAGWMADQLGLDAKSAGQFRIEIADAVSADVLVRRRG
ncbi:hypothetical protein [Maritimibacter sp. DP1N21-5]|uniref:hypothetical protein n=1 Tax=Maritimibacter sp. DP1N21-5 TaxID=2836867 RepID=UPI001C4751FD|nr:hypothetical protein [Maritimibacter sp. DP1N21-5]